MFCRSDKNPEVVLPIRERAKLVMLSTTSRSYTDLAIYREECALVQTLTRKTDIALTHYTPWQKTMQFFTKVRNISDYAFILRRKHSMVFSIRQQMVIGPTPPGTGVITEAFGSIAA